ASADGLDVRRARRVDWNGALQVRRGIAIERKGGVRGRTERRQPERPTHGDARESSRIARREQRLHQLREARLRLSRHRDVEAGLREHERIIRADLRSTHDHAGPRRQALHLARQMQAALHVPEVERQPEKLRLVPRHHLGEQGVAQHVRGGWGNDVDLQPRGEPVNASRHSQASRRERHVARGSERRGRWHGKLYEAEALHRWHGTCFRGPAQEATMTSIKATVQEWGYPAAVLISWLMATAY